MDGEWEPPVIQNPEYKVSGGGELGQPARGYSRARSMASCRSLPVPLSIVLQGEWKPRQIDNPDYKGVWIHPEIDNPEYAPDSNIYAFDSFGVLGLDLWQVRGAGRRRGHRGMSQAGLKKTSPLPFAWSWTCFTCVSPSGCSRDRRQLGVP